MLITVEELNLYTGGALNETEGSMWIAAAGQAIEGYVGRKLSRGEQIQEFMLDNTSAVFLNAYPVDADAEVFVTLDGNSLDGCILLENGILELDRRHERGHLMVNYTGGYPSDQMPQPIKVACALIASALASAAQSGGQIIASERLDGYSVSYQQQYTGQGLNNLCPAACALLNPYIAKGW